MTDSDRRDFLKKAAAAALGIAGAEHLSAADASAAPARAAVSGGEQAPQSVPSAGETLRAVANAVLPTADLGDEGIERVVQEFEAWIEGFVPEAELPHGYLNRGLAEIRYGPPHPGPRWSTQIEALEREATQQSQVPFTELPRERQRALIEGQLESDEIGRLPDPARARHVAIALLAFFYDSSAATDLCYRAAIGRYRCRPLSNAGQPPRALPRTPPPDAPDHEAGERATGERAR